MWYNARMNKKKSFAKILLLIMILVAAVGYTIISFGTGYNNDAVMEEFCEAYARIVPSGDIVLSNGAIGLCYRMSGYYDIRWGNANVITAAYSAVNAAGINYDSPVYTAAKTQFDTHRNSEEGYIELAAVRKRTGYPDMAQCFRIYDGIAAIYVSTSFAGYSSAVASPMVLDAGSVFKLGNIRMLYFGNKDAPKRLFLTKADAELKGLVIFDKHNWDAVSFDCRTVLRSGFAFSNEAKIQSIYTFADSDCFIEVRIGRYD